MQVTSLKALTNSRGIDLFEIADLTSAMTMDFEVFVKAMTHVLQVRHVIHSINEASEVIPGWDSYAKSGKAEQFWDGRTFKDNPRMTASYLT